MADTYSTANKARVLDSLTDLKEIIDKMIHQTVECAVFIQEYFDRGFGGEYRKALVIKCRPTNTSDREVDSGHDID
jgi:hypothetical protein